jgi:hypothetical protein
MKKRTVAKRTIAQENVLLELYREDISDLEKTLKRLTEACSQTLDVERVSVWFFNPEKSCIHCSNLCCVHFIHGIPIPGSFQT